MGKCSFCQYNKVADNDIFCPNCGSQIIVQKKETADTDRLKFWGGESRLVSIFFVNFTGIVDSKEKGKHRENIVYLAESMQEIENIIKQYDGTANRIVPDNRIMGIFGAPKAHHDDPQRTLKCVTHIKTWWEEKKRQQKVTHDLYMAIGVNTGWAFFGYVLEEPSFLTIIGDTVNIAARLAQICPPQNILISENTYQITVDYIEAEHAGERSIKGRGGKVNVYALKGFKEKEKVLAQTKVPLLGREKELNNLIAVANRIKNKKIAFCIITGQMGIGKTRIKEEFAEILKKDMSLALYETHCSVEIHTPYYPFKLLLRNYLKIADFDSKEIIAKKVEQFAAENGLTPADIKGIKHLFLADLRRVWGEQMAAIQEDIYTSVRNIIRFECKRNPLVLIFEEFNRADTMSKNLVAYLTTELGNEPLMLLMVNVTSEFLSNIPIVIEEINLGPLMLADVENLVKYILLDVDEKLVEFVYQASGGNPLFTIEAIRNIKRTKLIKKEESGRWFLEKEKRLSFLDDLYGVVMSGLDALSSESRLIIDYASVIGYSFNTKILERLIGETNLNEKLNLLKEEDYIVQFRDDHDPMYIFRHNLLKDAAYTALPIKKRKEIHQKVAELFEQLYAEDLSEYYENIAYQFLACENYKKAANYFSLAADKAKNVYAIEQAFTFYNTVLKINKDFSDSVVPAMVRNMKLNLADLYEIKGDVQRMKETAESGLEDARRDKETELELLFTERKAYSLYLLNEYDKAEEVLLNAIDKCSTVQISHVLTILYSDLGLLYAGRDEYEKSVLNYSFAWNVARTYRITEGEILCLLNLAQIHKSLGNYELAFDYLKYGMEELVSKDDLRRQAQFKFLSGAVNFQIWNLEKASQFLSESLAISELSSSEINIKSGLELAVLSSVTGKKDEALKYLQLVDKKTSLLVRESLLSEINLKKAMVFYNLKEFEKAANFTANALKNARKLSQKEVEFNCHILLSRINQVNKLDSAKTALEIAETMKLPPLIALALFTINQIALEMKDQEKVRYYGRKALLVYDDLKSKLKDENRQFFINLPEYSMLLGV